MVNVKKYLTRGVESVLNNVPIDDGKLRFVTDTGRLFLDNSNERIEITDFVKGLTEEEIKDILAPLPKIYLSSDTKRFFIHDGDDWICCAEKNNDNSINILYDNSNSSLDSTNVQDAINELANSGGGEIGISGKIVGKNISTKNSSDAPIVAQKVNGYTEQFTTTGKNLLQNTATTTTINGITFTVNTDGTVKAKGTATADALFQINNTFNDTSQKYILSGCPSGGSTSTYLMLASCRDASDAWKKDDCDTGTGKELSNDYAKRIIYILIKSGATVSNIVFKPMIRLASNVSTTYEPYTGGIASPNPDYPQEINSLDKVTVKTCGKNLLNREKARTMDAYGLKIVLNDDGSESVSGTATSSTFIAYGYFDGKAGEKYIVSGCPSGGAGATYKIGIYTSDYAYNYLTSDFGNGVTFTCNEDTRYFINLVVYKDTTVDLTYYPMARLAEIEDATYEPYVETSAEIDLVEQSLYEGDYIEYNADGTGKIVKTKGVYTITEKDNITINSTSSYGIYFNIAVDFIPKSSDTIRYNVTSKYFICDNPYSVPSDCIILMSHNSSYRDIRVRLSKCSTVNEFKSWLAENPVTIVYDLPTPIEIELTAEQIAQFKQLRTFKPFTNIISNGEATTWYYRGNDNGNVIGSLQDRIIDVDEFVVKESIISDEIVANNITTIQNTIDASVISQKVNGYTKQFTTTGKNLLNPTLQSNTSNGITFTKQIDGSYTMTGTQADTTTSSYVNLINGLKLPVGRYKLSGGVNSKIYIRLIITTNGASKNFYTYGPDYEFPIESENSTVSMLLVVGAGATPSGTFYPMIRLASITDNTYEPYTGGVASPNPDYPQEINSLDKVTVKTCGKNIFGGLTFAQALVNGSASATIDESTSTIEYGYDVISGSTKMFANFKENIQYTLILKGKGASTTNSNIRFRYTDGSSSYCLFGTAGTLETKAFTSTAGKTVESIQRFQGSNSITTLYYEECGIFEGNITVDEFESYIETSAEIDLTEPLNEGDYIEYNTDGTGKLYRKMGSIVFDGSSDETWSMLGTDTGRRFAITSFVKGVDKKNTVKTTHFPKSDLYSWTGMPDCSCLNADHAIGFKYFALATLNDWKSWLQANPITVVYELETPVEIELTAEQVAQFKQLRTFDSITNIICDGETEVQYYKNNDNNEVISGLQDRINDVENHTHDEYAEKSTVIPNNDLLKYFTLSTQGWYRIAAMNSTGLNATKGSSSNGCDIIIKRSYSNNSPEVHKVSLLTTFGSSTLVSNGDKSDNRIITKIRHVVDINNNKTYLEIYYDGTKNNPISVIINNGKMGGLYWYPIDPEETVETVEGVEVYSTLNFAYNSKGTATYDGNGNVIHDTYAAKSHTHSYGSLEFSPSTSAGNGGFIDFHYNKSTADYTSRIIENSSGTLSINGIVLKNDKTVSASTFTGYLSGTASSATNASTANYATNAGTSNYAKSAPTYKGATTAASGTAGLVPAATTATRTNFLRGDGTWATPSKATNADTATYAKNAGTATYATNAGTSNYAKSAPTYKGATTTASGTAGLVPAATTATRTSFLRGDGTWATPSNSSTANYATNAGTSNYSKNAGTATWSSTATYAVAAASDAYGNTISSSYLRISGGTMQESIITPKNNNMGILPHTDNYGQIGAEDRKFFRMYASTFYGNLSGNATSATYSSTATYAKNAGTASYVTNASTANYAKNAGTANYAKSAPTFKGATTAANGTAGFVPVATPAAVSSFLCGNGTWATPSKATNADTATYAKNAGTATKATQDGSGNNIVNTYIKKSSILSFLTDCTASTDLGEVASGYAVGELNTKFNSLVNVAYRSLNEATTSGVSVKIPLITASTKDALVNLTGYASFPGGGSNGQCSCNIMIENNYVYAAQYPPTNFAVNLPISGIYKLPAGQTLYLQLMQNSGQAKTVTGIIGVSSARL